MTTTRSSASRATRRPRRSRRPTASWPASCTRTSTRATTRRSASRTSRGPTTCCRTPRSAADLRHRRRPQRRPAAGSARASASATSSRASSARASRAARCRASARARTRWCASTSSSPRPSSAPQREISVDTAVVCGVCQGSCCQPGTGPAPCGTCGGRGQVQRVARSFLGQVMTTAPCPTCGGYGTVIPSPCLECSGEGRVRTRRTLTIKVPPGVDTGTRIQLTGQGEVGPGGGPPGDLYVEIREQRHEHVPPPRRRPALHRPGADDGRGARHHPRDRHPRRRREDRPGARHAVRRGAHAAGYGVTGLRAGRARRPARARRRADARPGSTSSRRQLLAELAELRGETRPSGRMASAHGGVFGKLRERFAGR